MGITRKKDEIVLKKSNAIDSKGRTALMEAACELREETADYLLENGADPLIWDRERKTAEDFARGNMNRAEDEFGFYEQDRERAMSIIGSIRRAADKYVEQKKNKKQSARQ